LSKLPSKEKPDAKLQRLIDDPKETLDPPTRTRIMTHIADARFSDFSQPLQKWSRIGADYVGLPHPSVPGQVLALATDLSSADWHATKAHRPGRMGARHNHRGISR
jgi:hypothetical protein